MRFYEINEAGKGTFKDKPFDEQEDSTKVVEFIEQNCQPFLKAIGYNMDLSVFRGVKDPSSAVFTKKVRKQRKPKDSHPMSDKMYRQIIKASGLEANRHNSMFVSGDIDIAALYGSIHVVFPIGEFNYTWSPSAEDWYSSPVVKHAIFQSVEIKDAKENEQRKKALLNNAIDILENDLESTKDQINHLTKTLERMKKIGQDVSAEMMYNRYEDSLHTHKKRLKDITKTLNDLYTEGWDKLIEYIGMGIDQDKDWYLRNLFSLITDNVKEWVFNNPKSFIFKPKKALEILDVKGDDDSLKEAIRSGKEIMIKADNAIYIQKYLFNRNILPLLRNKYNKLDWYGTPK